MKVKSQKPSDLVDALKHLKITDRRLRFPFRASIAHSLTTRSNVCSSRRLHFRLRRSVSSSNTKTYEFRCCSACQYCNEMNKCNSVFSTNNYKQSHTHSNELSDNWNSGQMLLSPFMSLTGSKILHNAASGKQCEYETDFEGANNDRSAHKSCVLEPKHHHSCGTELSNIDHEHVHLTSTTESPNSLSSHTPYRDRPFCCCHHDASIPLTLHLRLYRRLYSLVDHPCVNSYPCRRHTCTHATLSRGAFAFRHSLSLKSRHANVPAPGHRLNTSSWSKSPEAESYYGINDRRYLETPRSTVHDCQAFSFGAMQTIMHSPRLPCHIKFAGKNGSSEEQSMGNQRCRRNSDPERWQQFRNSRVQNQYSNESASSKLNDSSNDINVVHSHIGDSYDFLKSEIANAVAKTEGYTNATQLFAASDNFTFSNNPPADPSNLNANNRNLTYTANNSGVNEFSNTVACDRAVPSGQHSCFRSPILNQGSQQNAVDSLSTMHDYGSCRTGVDYRFNVFPGAQASDKNAFLSLTDELHKPLLTHSTDLQARMLRMNFLDDSDTNHIPDPNIIGNRSNLASDISVNELASYMEHMVHIPGRMSEMAQRMYL